MDSKTVYIHITGCQHDETGETTITETHARGQSYWRGNKQYLLYDDTNIIEGARVATILKIGEEQVVLIRKPPLNQRLEFIPGEDTASLYRTFCGEVDLAISTTSMQIADYSALQRRVEINYDLSLNGVPASHNLLRIDIVADSDH